MSIEELKDEIKKLENFLETADMRRKINKKIAEYKLNLEYRLMMLENP